MKRMTSAALVALLLMSALIGVQAAGGRATGNHRHRHRHSRKHTRRRSHRHRRAHGGAARRHKGRHCRGANVRPTRRNMRLVNGATVCLIDRARRRFGLAPLRANGDLHALAAEQAADMVRGRYFGDNSTTGRTPLQRAIASGYVSRRGEVLVGQNIGWGTGRLATPRSMVSVWMHSPPHRRIILTAAYRDIGAGVAPAAPTRRARGATYVLELATRS